MADKNDGGTAIKPLKGKILQAGLIKLDDGTVIKGAIIKFTEPPHWPISAVWECWDVEISVSEPNQSDYSIQQYKARTQGE